MVLVLLSFGVPVISLVYLLYHRQSGFKRLSVFSDKLFGYFLHHDFQADKFWLRHLNIGMLAALCLMNVFGDEPDMHIQVAIFGVTAFVVLGSAAVIVGMKPFARHQTWKAPVKIGTLLLAVLVLTTLAAVVFMQLPLLIFLQHMNCWKILSPRPLTLSSLVLLVLMILLLSQKLL